MRHLKWLLTTLATNTDINDPQRVKKWIEQHTTSGNYRNTFLCAYKQLRKFLGLKTDLDKYERNQREIRCPTKENLQMIIANSGKLMSLKLQISMNTGLRPVELFTLRTKDIDTEQKTIYPKTAKHGAPRKISISNTLNERIRNYIIKNDKQPNDQPFQRRRSTIWERIPRNPKQISQEAQQPNNPEYKTIRLQTLLRNNDLPQNTKHQTHPIPNGTQTQQHYRHLYTSTKHQRRRMDMQHSPNNRRSKTTNRSRIPIRHNNRRNTTI